MGCNTCPDFNGGLTKAPLKLEWYIAYKSVDVMNCPCYNPSHMLVKEAHVNVLPNVRDAPITLLLRQNDAYVYFYININ